MSEGCNTPNWPTMEPIEICGARGRRGHYISLPSLSKLMGRFIRGIRMPTSHFVKRFMYFTHKKCGSHVAHGSQQVTGWEKMRRLKNDQPPASTLFSFLLHFSAPSMYFLDKKYESHSAHGLQQEIGWENLSLPKNVQPSVITLFCFFQLVR